MQHYLIAAPVSFFGDGGGMFVERKNRECQGVVKSENLIDRRRIAADIIEDNRQLGGRRLRYYGRSAACDLWTSSESVQRTHDRI